MTIAVDWDVKNQTKQKNKANGGCHSEYSIYFEC